MSGEEMKEQPGDTYVDNDRIGRREGVKPHRALGTYKCLSGGDLLPS